MRIETTENKRTRTKRIDWDGAWKEAIQQFFEPFMALLFPEIHRLIDWSQDYTFLEQELRNVTRRAKRGKGAVDKLARVKMLDGGQTNLLIHMEFQHQVDVDLPARLYTYNTRIYSLLQEPVITLAVLGDDDPEWRVSEFGYTFGNFDTRMRFPVTKLLDLEAQWDNLERSNNQFALIVMAHLRARATMRRPDARLAWKVRLATSIYSRGYLVSQVQQLVNFIDWLMVLDEKREERFDESIREIEVEHTMETLSPYQRRFIAKGKQEALFEVLEARFEQVPDDISEAVYHTTSPAVLSKLLRAAGLVPTLDAFRSLLTQR